MRCLIEITRTTNGWQAKGTLEGKVSVYWSFESFKSMILWFEENMPVIEVVIKEELEKQEKTRKQIFPSIRGGD